MLRHCQGTEGGSAHSLKARGTFKMDEMHLDCEMVLTRGRKL